jgi:HSP20 family protein
MTTLVRWNPAYRMRPGRTFARFAPYWDSRVAMPLDIEENEDNFVIKASVPGFSPEDIKIEVEDGFLTIRAEQGDADEQERDGWHLRERYSGTVERRLRLGKNVNTEAIEAELEHGVLTLSLSKVEEAKPKLIEVKVAK